MLPKKTKALMDKGRALKADDSAMEKLILSRLGENIVQGKDSGTQSAKVLGSHRDLNMWKSVRLSGVIILQTPPRLSDPEIVKRCLKWKSKESIAIDLACGSHQRLDG